MALKFVAALSLLLMICRVSGGALHRGLSDASCPAFDYAGALRSNKDEFLTFVNGLSGTVIMQGQPQYDKARNLTYGAGLPFNTRTPWLIVYCLSDEDVAKTVKFAAKHNVTLCVRSGGHDSSGASICDEGIVLDVSRMTQIQIFPTRQEAHLQAGVAFEDLLNVAAEYEMTAATGICPTVHASGYLGGGGWGMWNKMYGLGVDNILEMNVVLPSVRLVTANNHNKHSDLFWAMRGGGHGNFGVMTSLKYRIIPNIQVLLLTISFDLNNATRTLVAQALNVWQTQFLDEDPQELTIYPGANNAGSSGALGIQFACIYTNSNQTAEADLQRLLAPLISLAADPHVAYVAPPMRMTMPMLEATLQEGNTQGGAVPTWMTKYGQYVNKGVSLEQLQTLVDGWILPSPVANTSKVIWLEQMEGKTTRVKRSATAFVHRNPGWDMVIQLVYPNLPGNQDKILSYLDDIYFNKYAHVVNGEAYQNYPVDNYPTAKAVHMYYAENICRLSAIKRKYDPKLVFNPKQGVPLHAAGC